MGELTFYHYFAMVSSLLILLFGTGWLIRKKPHVEVLEYLLIREYDNLGFGLKFEGRIVNSGEGTAMLKKAETFLYLWEGFSIRSHFTVGLRKLDDEKGYLLPLPIESNKSYEIAGFEIKPHFLHNEDVAKIFDREDLILRCKISCSRSKPIVFRCGRDGMIKRNKFSLFLKENIARFRQKRI